MTLRVFGELAYRVSDPTALLAKLIGTGAGGDLDGEIATWVKDQTLAAVRVVLPEIVAGHGVLAMGQLQEPTAAAALKKANETLAGYGLELRTFGELNVNLPDADAQQLKQLAAAKAYTAVAGSFEGAVRGEAALEIAHGVAAGNVGAQPAIVAGMMMGVPVAPGAASGGMATATATTGVAAGGVREATAAEPVAEARAARFCSQCGAPVMPGARFCGQCGAALTEAQG